ncbi:MAG: DUF2306 domain-containing protein [Proteobacteria bacterium]|nr:DUF2306 domain-containing protein [Pseudomonadota bacterium]
MTPTIAVHTIAALIAVPLGVVILTQKKGTPTHKALGRMWVVLLTITALTGIFIREINDGGFSLIHLLIPITLLGMARAFWCIHRFRQTRNPYYMRRHFIAMAYVYAGLLGAGAFAFWPGRLLSQLLFG